MNPQFLNYSFMLHHQIILSSGATSKSVYMKRLIFAMLINAILPFPHKHCNAQASHKDTLSACIVQLFVRMAITASSITRDYCTSCYFVFLADRDIN